MKITLTKEETRQLWREEELNDLTLHSEGDWDVDTKWQHMTNIYFQEETGKYFEMTVSRSGSPFTDWYYSFEDSGAELNEVKLVEEVTVVKSWERV